MKAALVGAARGLGLLERMPERFRARGWALDDRLHVATAAVCCVALRQGRVRFLVQPGTDDHECWTKIKGMTPAVDIVEALELEDMLVSGRMKSSRSSKRRR